MAKKKNTFKKNKINKSVEKIDNNVNSDKIEVEGQVVEVLPGNFYLVKLPNGHEINAYVSGKMRMNMIRILKGDKVTLEICPYDLTRGRIIWNKK